VCLALASSLVGCNQLEAIETESGGGGGGGIPQVVREAFAAGCADAACHADGGPVEPTLEGAALDDILTGQVNGVPYVTIGDTANSYIAIVMLPPALLSSLGLSSTVPRMPADGDYDNAYNQTILAWIAGAEFDDAGGSTTGDTDTGGTTTGGSEPTFANVQAILDVKCVACHGSAPDLAINGNLQMPMGMAYASIVDVPSPTVALDLVEPGDPAASYLYLKLTGEFSTVAGSTGMQMPIAGMLTPAELTLIEEWITMGAPEN
jgi:hypothetical protein